MNVFIFDFLDEVFDAKYKSEERLGNILKIFTPIIVFIACLGLLGLTYFNVSQKAKEISIRKILGATVISILFLIIKGFLYLISISIIIAFLISYYVSSKWLHDFPYRVNLSWLPFLIPAAGILAVSMATMLTLIVKAAKASPAKNLKPQ